MTLHLTPEQLQQIAAHAEHTYPEECCGVLIGKIDRVHPTAKTLLEVWQVTNAWSAEIAEELSTVIPAAATSHPNDKADRYWIDPRELLRAQRHARDQQLQIIGIYHSHPDHTAVPSECDRRLAWSQYSYLIVAVHQGKAQDKRCWSLDEQNQFQPEAIVIQ